MVNEVAIIFELLVVLVSLIEQVVLALIVGGSVGVNIMLEKDTLFPIVWLCVFFGIYNFLNHLSLSLVLDVKLLSGVLHF